MNDRMKIKTILSGIIILALVICWIGSGAAMAAGVTRISFASSGLGAVFHVMVGGLAPYASQHLKDIEVTAEATRGSVENVRLIKSKKSEMAFVAGTIVYMSSHMMGPFKEHKETFPELRGVSSVYVGIHHWVTLAKSGIRTMQDLKGKTICVGPSGSAVAAASKRNLKMLGFSKQVKIRHLGWAEAATALKDGNVDVFAAMSALPVPAVIDVASTHKIRILPVDPQLMKKLIAANPANFLTKIPANTYKGLNEDIPVSGYNAFWLTHKDVSPDVVYKMLKFTYKPSSRKFLENVHPGWKMMEPGIEKMTKLMGVPLHPGAERYYKEVGILK